MKFFVEDKEKEFFVNNGLLLLEDVFSQQEIDDLRLAGEERALSGNFKDLALSGGQEHARKILFSQTLAQLAFGLVGKTPLRYGYDLFFRLSSPPKGLFSSLRPLKIGACIALESREGDQESHVVPFTLRREDLPRTKGSVLFFSPGVTFSLEDASSEESSSFFFLLFGGTRVQYIFQPDDPYTHELKRFGYVFGDNVRVATHPFLYR